MPKILSPKLFPLCPFGYPPLGKELVFTLQQGMEFYWRVKRWDARIIATLTRPSGDPVVINEQFNLQTGTGEARGSYEIPYPGIAPSSESNLVCPAGSLWGWDSSAPVGPYTLFFASAQGGLSIQCRIAANQYYKNGENYQFNIYVIALSAFAQAALEPTYNTFPNLAVCGSFTIQLNEGLVSAPLYCRYFNGYFIDLNIQMQPLEYWSYGGTWNTSTGQPL
jgi:hypothetical protein